MKLIAHQDDTLDSVLYRQYGRTAELVEIALKLNPQLAHQPILNLGQEIEMPDILPTQQAIKATIQLWN
ncbi:tail protein X [Ursidibacter arcticus]